MPMTPEDMRKAIIANLPEKTGRSLDDWTGVLVRRGPKTRKERIAWLKEEHGLGHGQAQTIVFESEKPGDYRPPSGKELVAAQYTGDKAALRLIYDRLVKAARGLGKDVSIEPRHTYVSLNRKRQFALIQPSTKTRVDLGLVLPGISTGGRLKAAGSFGSARITHKVSLTSVDDVDREVRDWLKTAYEKDL